MGPKSTAVLFVSSRLQKDVIILHMHHILKKIGEPFLEDHFLLSVFVSDRSLSSSCWSSGLMCIATCHNRACPNTPQWTPLTKADFQKHGLQPDPNLEMSFLSHICPVLLFMPFLGSSAFSESQQRCGEFGNEQAYLTAFRRCCFQSGHNSYTPRRINWKLESNLGSIIENLKNVHTLESY